MRTLFFVSFSFAVVVSIATTCLCVISGAGAILDLLAVCSVFLLLLGTFLSTSALQRGSVLSMTGIGACAIVLLVCIAELLHAIPFRQQPGQTSLLYVPLIFLAALLLHLASIRRRLRDAETRELVSKLS